MKIKEIQQGLNNKDFSVRELVERKLALIGEKDKDLNSFITIDGDNALKRADKIDERLKKGEDLPLAGVCVGVKDNILFKNVRCTAGSNILSDYTAVYSATVVDRLLEKGAIILGKLNLDEFAMGSSGEYSAFGVTKSPIGKDLVPGGSSSGPAVAVLADFCDVTLGSDTGGSIRQPAAFCGVVGLKPTYGAVSRYGLISLSSSLDQIGPLAKNVEDAEIIFDIISGKDEKDATSVNMPQGIDVSGLKIGVPKEFFTQGLDPKVEASIRGAIKKYEQAGATIKEISLPNSKYSIAVYQIIMTAEASSNLARYDGIRYGLRNDADTETLEEVYSSNRTQGFSKEVRRRIMLGTYVLSSGYYDAYYARALKVRNKIKQDFDSAFEKVDYILTPTTPTTPFKFGEKLKNPLEMYLSDMFTASVNLAGLPAISIPCYNIDNLPVGLQIIGKPFSEKSIFATAKIFEDLK